MKTPQYISQSTNNPRPKKSGFTLVELLVVIGIIALLIAILLPALGKARKAANTVKCAANLHSMGQAMALYINQYRRYPGHAGADSRSTFAVWPVRLRNMMNGNTGAFHCPAQEENVGNWSAWVRNPPNKTLLAKDEDSGWGYDIGEQLLDVHAFVFSYGYNDWGTVNVGTNPYLGLGADLWLKNPNYNELNPSRVVRSAEMIAICDIITPGPGGWNFNADPTSTDGTQTPSQIHDGGANVLFCDGHATRMRQEDLVLWDVKTKSMLSTSNPRYAPIAQLWNNNNKSY